MQETKNWEHFSHAADIGVRGYGITLEDAFAMGAMALTAIITNPNKVKPLTEVNIACQAPDSEILFNDWLNAIIYEMETRNMLFSQFHVQIEGLKLQARIKGEPIERIRHQPAADVKGATYTALKVYKEKDLWVAQCIIDV